jgi:hypothetical protein
VNLIVAAAPAALMLVALLSLTRRSERPSASLLWLPCLSVAVTFVETFAVALGLFKYDAFPIPQFRAVSLFYPYGTYLSLVPVLVAVCWLVTDVRPLAALTLQFLLERAFYSATWHLPVGNGTQMAIVAGLSLALACALLWLLRHRARTAPPSIG